MRKIKFRIWNGSRFEYWGFIHDEHGVSFAAPSSNSRHPMSYKEREERSEQFTGIHDKNGREIYEGDIIRGWKPNSRARFNVVVKWVIPGEYAEYANMNDIEVIGNIHETPELVHE